MSDKIKVAVIGAGPGGYVCAIRLAQLGMEVTCFDKWVDEQGGALLGGTCLNVGCIPSKALLESSHKFSDAKYDFAAHGISQSNLKIDIATMQKRKAGIVSNFTKGVAGLLKANGVKVVIGEAKLEANRTVHVSNQDKNSGPFDHIVLATGSTPIEIGIAPFNEKQIIDSTGALELAHPPKTLGIIGAGVIGLELGSVWSRLGSKVIIWEALEDFLPMCDQAISRMALKELKSQGLDIRLKSKVNKTEIVKEMVNVYLQGDENPEVVDVLAVAVGRKANGLQTVSENQELKPLANGSIEVNEFCQTSMENVWAIGDLVRGPMLAHKASHEGIMVAERIAGQNSHFNLDVVPSVIYTHPEVSWVGKNEQELKEQGSNYKVGSFPFAALGRAAASGSTSGMVKMISCADTDTILGVHILGAHSSELIATATTAIEFEATAEDLALTIFAHPTLSESIHEAALDSTSGSIHTFRKR